MLSSKRKRQRPEIKIIFSETASIEPITISQKSENNDSSVKEIKRMTERKKDFKSNFLIHFFRFFLRVLIKVDLRNLILQYGEQFHRKSTFHFEKLFMYLRLYVTIVTNEKFKIHWIVCW